MEALAEEPWSMKLFVLRAWPGKLVINHAVHQHRIYSPVASNSYGISWPTAFSASETDCP